MLLPVDVGACPQLEPLCREPEAEVLLRSIGASKSLLADLVKNGFGTCEAVLGRSLVGLATRPDYLHARQPHVKTQPSPLPRALVLVVQVAPGLPPVHLPPNAPSRRAKSCASACSILSWPWRFVRPYVSFVCVCVCVCGWDKCEMEMALACRCDTSAAPNVSRVRVVAYLCHSFLWQRRRLPWQARRRNKFATCCRAWRVWCMPASSASAT